MVTLVMLLEFKNAPPAILVTGFPSMVPGITTFPPVPVYPLIVISPPASSYVKAKAAVTVTAAVVEAVS